MDLDTSKPFIWRKKYEELNIIDEKEMEADVKRQIEANKVELAKIKERQRLRELEHQQKINDDQYLQRQKEAEAHQNFISQDDEFQLKQHRLRSRIRIRDGRAQPIDLLAYYIEIFGAKIERTNPGTYLQEEDIDISDSPVELLNPCYRFNGLRQAELEALESEIKIYMSADCDQNQEYWRDLLDITTNEIFKLQAVADNKKFDALKDVMSRFEGKSIEELDDMEKVISSALCENDPSIDVAFYQDALRRLRAHRAKTRLTLNHEKNLERQKDVSYTIEPVEEAEQLEEEDVKEDEVDTRTSCVENYNQGGYSPKMYRESQLASGTVFVDYKKEYELLKKQRNQVCHGPILDDIKTISNEERAFVDAASKGMNTKEESMFSCEAEIKGPNNKAHTYAWADKYQPRKPRYFNRVHTGFEWNKYNQVHYDTDTPPPKVVQGYKFNIFYPDLIDSSKAPTFTLTPCKDDKDFCIIRFSAGPPYEDIAFRIVNREWNNSHKSGYRCQFINNMLQLWFQFKRYRYRR